MRILVTLLLSFCLLAPASARPVEIGLGMSNLMTRHGQPDKSRERKEGRWILYNRGDLKTKVLFTEKRVVKVIYKPRKAELLSDKQVTNLLDFYGRPEHYDIIERGDKETVWVNRRDRLIVKAHHQEGRGSVEEVSVHEIRFYRKQVRKKREPAIEGL